MKKDIRLIKHTLELTEHEIATLESVARKANTELTNLYGKIARKSVNEMSAKILKRYNLIRDATLTMEALQGKLQDLLSKKGALKYEFPQFKQTELKLKQIESIEIED